MKGLSKKGVVSTMGVVITVVAVLVIGYIIYAFYAGDDGKIPCDANTPCSTDYECVAGKCMKITQLRSIFSSEGGDVLNIETAIKSETARKPVKFIFQYIFGMHSGTLKKLGINSGELNELSIRGVMILIAVWFIFFLIFTDMAILVVGHRSAVNGFLIGLAVSILFANFGLYYSLIIWLMGIFAFLAGLSVIAALFSIIVLGVGAHFGAGWALTAIKTKSDIWKIRAGADTAAEGIRAAKTIAEGARS